MIDHLEFKVLNFQQCLNWYAAILSILNIELKWNTDNQAGFGFYNEHERVAILIEKTDKELSPLHIAFEANSVAQVENFFKIGTENGGTVKGAPGFRPNFGDRYFASFVLDPDRNNIEFVYRGH